MVRRSTRRMKVNYGSCERETEQRYLQFTPLREGKHLQNSIFRKFLLFDLCGVVLWLYNYTDATTGEALCNTTPVSSLLSSVSLPTSSRHSPHVLLKSERIRYCSAAICAGSAVPLQQGTPPYEPTANRSLNCCTRT